MTSKIVKYFGIGVLFVLAGAATAWGQSEMQDYDMQNMSEDHMAHGDHAMHAMQDEHAGHGDHAMHDMKGMSADEHAAHRAMLEQKSEVKVSMENYKVPDVTLVDEFGKAVALRNLLIGDHPVAVNFIFTTCTTICPVMTATFAQMRRELGSEADRIQLVSITIDPEHDTPSVLAEYAEKFDAKTANWRFLTGKSADIEHVLRTFGAWTGTKTNHRPVTLFHAQGKDQWVRLEGLGSGTALAQQARTVIQ